MNDGTNIHKKWPNNKGPIGEKSSKKTSRRVRTPTQIQIEIAESGAVSLAILLAYYGKYVPIEELRIACNVTRSGNSAQNIAEAAKSYGLEAHGFSITLDELTKRKLPAITLLSLQQFIVIEGYDSENYYINDPATGPRIISKEEFESIFTGIVIELYPSSSFVRSGKPESIIRMICKQFSNVKVPLIFLFFTALGMIIPELALPAFSQLFIDQIFIGNQWDWIWGLLAALSLSILVCGLLEYLQYQTFIILQHRLSGDMASSAFRHLLRMPVSFFTQRYPGELAYRLVLIDQIVLALTSSLTKTVLDLLVIVIFVAAMAYYDPVLALIALSAGVFNILLFGSLFRSLQDDLGRYQSFIGKYTSIALGMLENISTIKAMGMENRLFSVLMGYFTKFANALQQVRKKNLILSVASPLINALVTALFIGVAALKVLKGELSIGMFSSLQILLINFMGPLLRMMNFGGVVQKLKVNLSRLHDLTEYPIDPIFNEKSENNHSISYKKIAGSVELNGVTFGYSKLEPPLLENIDLKLFPGKSAAIVGQSGSGKSTLAMIIAGMLQPWSGEIFYDGENSKQILRQQLTNSLIYVSQQPFIFKGTIKDNISLLNPLIPLEEISKAAKDACIHQEIMERPGGYENMIDDNGLNLSGGQKQRIEIARGLLANPAVLVLDECSSALNADLEDNLMRNIHRRGCAILMIAHRLNSIINCDEICVLEKGKIIDRGSHEKLIQTSPLYQKLWESEEVTTA